MECYKKGYYYYYRTPVRCNFFIVNIFNITHEKFNVPYTIWDLGRGDFWKQ